MLVQEVAYIRVGKYTYLLVLMAESDPYIHNTVSENQKVCVGPLKGFCFTTKIKYFCLLRLPKLCQVHPLQCQFSRLLFYLLKCTDFLLKLISVVFSFQLNCF